ncbi:methyl-accepting chemotaxis protein [Marinomonas pollencensis]|uniref:Methyl-accepting chemotaxis protein n=1 Tax=Marinomonas pollencensis TaxID=491954 RepID=A0A3E0DJ48_9GAMM|nr:methyl-accepting chemotaxis protein [Marinomonas pollencensis]REG81471.1 methyl-accepting chemotaxis protein [Marinomonas pollencensis]
MALSIKMRLVLMGTLLAVVPTIIVGLIVSHNALNKGTEALQHNAEKQLVLSRDLTAESIETYFSFIDRQISSLAHNNSTLAAAHAFSKAFASFPTDTNPADDKKLKHYYEQQFDNNFRTLNGGQSSQPENLLTSLSPIAKAMQEDYISNNPAPLGEKDHLTSANNKTAYDTVHQEFHPMFHEFQQRFGFYDVFLVDANNGHVIYSVFKELDFATSLISGPYKDSGLGQAFKAAAHAPKDTTYLTDFAPYIPSYNAAASFISTPVVDNGKTIAVLIFQMPIDRINSVMSHQQNWQNSGLGETGQTYLVGSDNLMRSNDRLLVENKAAFLEKAGQLNLPNDTLNAIAQRNTTMNLLTVDGEGIQEAIAGKTGFVHANNYLGVPSLIAYKPLNIHGMQWVIISEISKAEALSSVTQLQSTIYKMLSSVSLIALIVGALLGLLVANIIVRPIKAMGHMMHNIAMGEGDLTQRLPTKDKDELADLAQGINTFIAHIDKTFSSVLASVIRLKPISEDMADVNGQLSLATEQQKSQAEQVNACLSDTNESTLRVKAELEQISKATTEGNQTVHSSSQVVNHVAHTMDELSNDISLAVDAISKLKDDTDRIAGIIDVINGISEQTNLLALNAAIEAARAGEMGRGFAVVADEVRSLASKTRQSTDEVANMVEAIQTGTLAVVKQMEISKSNAEQSSKNTGAATNSLTQVKAAMEIISGKVEQISHAIESQQNNFLDVTAHYDEMKQSFVAINQQTEHSTLVGHDVIKLADGIIVKIEQFKVSDEHRSTERRDLNRHADDQAT